MIDLSAPLPETDAAFAAETRQMLIGRYRELADFHEKALTSKGPDPRKELLSLIARAVDGAAGMERLLAELERVDAVHWPVPSRKPPL